MKLDIIGGSYGEPSVNKFSTRQCINWIPYVFPPTENNKAQAVLRNTEGYTLFSEIDTTLGSSIKSCIEYNDIGYFICNNTFYSVDPVGAVTSIGTITSTVEKPCLIPGTYIQAASGEASSGYIMICAGQYGYTYDVVTETFAQITHAEFVGANQGTYQNGRWFVVYNNIIYISDTNDPTSWSLLNFVSEGYQAAKFKAAISYTDDLYFISDNLTENYFDTGSATIIEKRDRSTIHYGIAAVNSLLLLNNSLFWVTRSVSGELSVIQYSLNEIKVHSAGSISKTLFQNFDVTDAFAYGYAIQGHVFYQITFPSLDRTFVFNLDSGIWSEKSSYKKTSGTSTRYGRHTGNCHMYLAHQHIIGDYESGRLYKLDPDVYTEDGEAIIRTFTSKCFAQDLKFSSDAFLSLDYSCSPTDPNTNSIITLNISKDGGHTYGADRQRDLGLTGDHKKRASWKGLGVSRDFVFKFTTSVEGEILIGDATFQGAIGTK